MLPRRTTSQPAGGVGSPYAGPAIDHVLPGMHHVLVAGEETLTIVEPESGETQSYSIPEARGLTWTKEGLLGLLTAEDNELIVHAINELRRGHAAGFTARPPLG